MIATLSLAIDAPPAAMFAAVSASAARASLFSDLVRVESPQIRDMEPPVTSSNNSTAISKGPVIELPPKRLPPVAVDERTGNSAPSPPMRASAAVLDPSGESEPGASLEGTEEFATQRLYPTKTVGQRAPASGEAPKPLPRRTTLAGQITAFHLVPTGHTARAASSRLRGDPAPVMTVSPVPATAAKTTGFTNSAVPISGHVPASGTPSSSAKLNGEAFQAAGPAAKAPSSTALAGGQNPLTPAIDAARPSPERGRSAASRDLIPNHSMAHAKAAVASPDRQPRTPITRFSTNSENHIGDAAQLENNAIAYPDEYAGPAQEPPARTARPNAALPMRATQPTGDGEDESSSRVYASDRYSWTPRRQTIESAKTEISASGNVPAAYAAEPNLRSCVMERTATADTIAAHGETVPVRVTQGPSAANRVAREAQSGSGPATAFLTPRAAAIRRGSSVEPDADGQAKNNVIASAGYAEQETASQTQLAANIELPRATAMSVAPAFRTPLATTAFAPAAVFSRSVNMTEPQSSSVHSDAVPAQKTVIASSRHAEQETASQTQLAANIELPRATAMSVAPASRTPLAATAFAPAAVFSRSVNMTEPQSSSVHSDAVPAQKTVIASSRHVEQETASQTQSAASFRLPRTAAAIAATPPRMPLAESSPPSIAETATQAAKQTTRSQTSDATSANSKTSSPAPDPSSATASPDTKRPLAAATESASFDSRSPASGDSAEDDATGSPPTNTIAVTTAPQPEPSPPPELTRTDAAWSNPAVPEKSTSRADATASAHTGKNTGLPQPKTSSDASDNSVADLRTPAAVPDGSVAPPPQQPQLSAAVAQAGSQPAVAAPQLGTAPLNHSSASHTDGATADAAQSQGLPENPARNLDGSPVTPVLVQSARVIERMGQTEMRVGVNTADFGSVELRAGLSQDRVGASISAAHSELHAAMMAEMPSLERAIEEHHLHLDVLDFSSQSGNYERGPGAQQQQQRPQSATTSGGRLSRASDWSTRTGHSAAVPWIEPYSRGLNVHA